MFQKKAFFSHSIALTVFVLNFCQVSEFHEFVKPQWKPKLSEFCQNLTGVTQVNHCVVRLNKNIVFNFVAISNQAFLKVCWEYIFLGTSINFINLLFFFFTSSRKLLIVQIIFLQSFSSFSSGWLVMNLGQNINLVLLLMGECNF